MAVNVKILIEGMVECLQQLLAPCVCTLFLTESKVRIDYLLYAANVDVSDHLFGFEHCLKTVYPFLKACEGTVGEIYATVLQIRSYEQQSVGCQLEVELVGVQLDLKFGLQIAADVFDHLLE